MIRFLHQRGYTADDVHHWAVIVSEVETEAFLERYLTSPVVDKLPSFILLEVLRQRYIKGRTFKLLMAHIWGRLFILDVPPDGPMRPKGQEMNMDTGTGERPLRASQTLRNADFAQGSTLEVMIYRLLRHARQVWPAVLPNISKMITVYLRYIVEVDERVERGKELSLRTRHKLTNIHNKMLQLLARPASEATFLSARCIWRAQQILLLSAADFQPSLDINQESYRSIIRALSLTKNSDRESTFARLQAATWPPWRQEEDGVDAARSKVEDLSRVVEASYHMQEAGYPLDQSDIAMNILGGREPDGTPTIRTRATLPRRTPRKPLRGRDLARWQALTQEWTARIMSTRSVYEAWSAFLASEAKHVRPSLSMYTAVFEKIIYETIKARRRAHEPEDDENLADRLRHGKQAVLSPQANLSAYERERTQPPNVDELYDRMINRQIRPDGKCLFLLVAYARTLKHGIQYLQDSTLPASTVQMLVGNERPKRDQLLKIPRRIFQAYVTLLCRFALRGGSTGEDGNEGGTRCSYDHKVVNPLLRAVRLMELVQPIHRPSWNALFVGLAKRDVVTGHYPNRSLNDIAAWRLLCNAFYRSQSCGLDINPHGFSSLCRGYEKAIHAGLERAQILRLPLDPWIRSTLHIVKDAFAQMSSNEPRAGGPSGLIYDINGASLHGYIRVLGLMEDWDELLNLLLWMAEHKAELDDSADEARNGRRMLRRCLVAVRVAVDGMAEVDEQARNIVEGIQDWGGWATAEEVLAYNRIEGSPC